MEYQFCNNIFLMTEEEGGILFNQTTEQFYGLDKVGCAICQAIEKKYSREQIISYVMDRFEVEYGQVSCDVERLIDLLVSKNLVSVADEK